MTDELQETDRIERDLARTRARMDGRLDELQDKMSPAQLANDALAYFQGGDGADFTANLIGRAKANPLPVALVGIGLAWLMASGHQRTPSGNHLHGSDLHMRLSDAERGVVRFAGEDDDAHNGRLDDARGRVLGIAREASDTASSYAQRIKDAVGSASQTARRSAHDARNSASRSFAGLNDQAGQGTQSLYEGTARMAGSMNQSLSSVTGNPLALGAVAAIVGVVAGSLLPTLDQEEAALGSVASKLKSAGRDLAQDVADRGGRMANETLAAVKDSAGTHGLSGDKSVGDVVQGLKSGELIGDVKQVAQDTLQAGRDSAQSQLGGSKDNPSTSG